jgi:hypothetical protein
MSPQKRRPQPRKGRTAVAAHKAKKGSDRTLTFVGIGVLVVGITLVFVLKPATSHAGLQLGDHWHAALGVYACDHWDGDADWATPVNPSTNGPVQAGTNTYAALHSHRDGVIHMEPAVTADTGDNATLGNYFKYNGFELSSTHIKFVTADLKNGDKCGTAKGTLHWLVNGKERTGDPTKYQMRDGDWIVIAFLPDSKKITSLGKPPSFGNLEGALGRETPGNAPATSAPATSPAPTPTSTPAPATTGTTTGSTTATSTPTP